MTDTLGSTFATWFGAEPDTGNECMDCGAKNDLTILYTTEEGNSAKVCTACKSRRATEAEAGAAKAQANIDEWALRDAWEEE